MNFLIWIIFGTVAGWIASQVIKDEERPGFFGDIILGVSGAIVGGLLMSFFSQSENSFSLYTLFVSTLGASVLIWFGRRFI